MSKISKLNSLPLGTNYQPGDIVTLPSGREFVLNNAQEWVQKKSGDYLEDKGILNYENLNIINVQGIYHQLQNTLATLANNYPTESAGILEVRFSSADQVFQKYTVLSGQINEDTIYTRGFYNGVWSLWKKQFNESNLNPNNFVTLSTDQIITGVKTINKNIGTGTGWGLYKQTSLGYSLILNAGTGVGSSSNQTTALGFLNSGTNDIQASIIVRTNNTEGTSMGFSTTNSFGLGPQLAMTISGTGLVNFVRQVPTFLGNPLAVANAVVPYNGATSNVVLNNKDLTGVNNLGVVNGYFKNLYFENAPNAPAAPYPYIGFYMWGNELQVNSRNASNIWQFNLLTINTSTKFVTFSGNVKGTGFIKDGYDDNYFLLAGGGTQLKSDFALASSLAGYVNNFPTNNTNLNNFIPSGNNSAQIGFTYYNYQVPLSTSNFTNIHPDMYQGMMIGGNDPINVHNFGIFVDWTGQMFVVGGTYGLATWYKAWTEQHFSKADIDGWKAMQIASSNFVTLNTNQTIDSIKTFNGATGNGYTGAAIMINGNGNANTVYPTLAFHQPTLYAGTISYRNDSEFAFMNINGDSYKYAKALGFIKSDSDNNSMLLAGGGSKLLSDFALATNYVKKSGDSMSGPLSISTSSDAFNVATNGSVLSAHFFNSTSDSIIRMTSTNNPFWDIRAQNDGSFRIDNNSINRFNIDANANINFIGNALNFNGNTVATQTWVSQQGFASNTSLNSYLPKTGGSMSGMILFDNNLGGIQGTMADNDFWRVGGGNTGSNNGYLELATGDDSNEEIYVSQYAGQFTSLVRRAKLLAADGNTYFPQTVSANAFVKNGSSGDLMLMGNGSEVSRYLFDSNFVHSGRNFPNGTLIQTSIDYSQSEGDAWILEIKGNTYGRQMPINMTVQGYIYSNTIISIGAYSTIQMNGFIALNLNGKLCFWFPSMGYWEGYSIKCYDVMGGVSSSLNRVTSIDNADDPGGTKRVAINIKVLANTDNVWSKYIVNGFTGINAITPFSVLNGTVQQSILTGGLLASDDYNDVSKIPYLGIHSKGLIQSEDGFQNRTYKVNQRNKIWNFGDSSQFGLSYYQGSYNALGEGIAFHFGDATDYKFYIKDNGNTYQRGSVNINVTSGHIFLSENNVNKWYIESVGGEFNITQSGVAQRFRILPNASTPTYNNFGLWHEGNHTPFKTRISIVNLNEAIDSGIYRQELPTSGFNYTTTLNLSSTDGRQQLTIERSGGGMKFRGTIYGSGDQGWSPWHNVWSDLDFSSSDITNWINIANNGVTKGDDQFITGLKSFNRAQSIGPGWGNTTDKTKHSIVIETNVGNNPSANFGGSIGFRSGGSEIQAGIYVKSNGQQGTLMAFATTHSFATGPQIGMTIDNYGIVDFPRGLPTFGGSSLSTQSYVNSNTILIDWSAQTKNGPLTLNSGLGLPTGQRIALKGLGDGSHYIKHFTSDDSVGFGINTKFVVKPYNDEGINFFSVDENGLTTMRNAQINGILKFKVTQFDLTGLDPNTYYPVTLSLSTNRYTKIKVYRTLYSGYGVPPYSNHGTGFMCMFEIDVLGHGWGTTDGKAYLREYKNFWVNGGIETIGYKQMNNSTQAVVYLRGGSKYDFEADIENTPVLRTSYYEIYGEVAEPTTTRIWQQFVDSRTDTLLNSFVTTNTDQKISGVKQFNAFGGSYTQFALQAYSDTGASPGIAFHKSGYYAGSIQLVGNDLFSFRNISGTILADIQARNANLATFNAEGGEVFGELYVGGKIYHSGSIHNSYNDYDYLLTSDGQARPVSDFQGSGTRVKFRLVTSGKFNPPDEKDLHFNLVNDSSMKLYLENLSSTSYGMIITVTHRNSGCVTEIWRGGSQLSGFSNDKQHKFMYTPLGWQWIDDTNSTSWI